MPGRRMREDRGGRSPRLVSRGRAAGGNRAVACDFARYGGVRPVGGRGRGRPWLDARGWTVCWPGGGPRGVVPASSHGPRSAVGSRGTRPGASVVSVESVPRSAPDAGRGIGRHFLRRQGRPLPRMVRRRTTMGALLLGAGQALVGGVVCAGAGWRSCVRVRVVSEVGRVSMSSRARTRRSLRRETASVWPRRAWILARRR